MNKMENKFYYFIGTEFRNEKYDEIDLMGEIFLLDRHSMTVTSSLEVISQCDTYKFEGQN